MLTRATTPRTERAFTLIELLVAMVIASIMLAFVAGILVRTVSSGDKAAEERKAVEAVEETMTTMSDDVRRIASPHRSPEVLNDPVVLQAALLRRDGVVDGTNARLDVRDIVEATGSVFAFRADVSPNNVGGPDECVRYAVTGTPPQLVRQVWTQANAAPATGCGGTMISSSVLVEQVR